MEFLKILCEDLSQLNHIDNVVQECIILYRKRMIETRRAIKAMHRSETIPEPREVVVMLDAEVNYYLNLSGHNAICALVESVQSGKVKNESQIFRNQFLKTLEIDCSLQDIHPKDVNLLISIFFSTDESYQRKTMIKFLLKNYVSILTSIFQDIAIFDEIYTVKILKELEVFLKENNSL